MIRRIAAAAVAGTFLALATTVTAGATVTGQYYGPYPDRATCEYWRGGIDPGGANTEPCFYDMKGGWKFFDRR
ncbi:hypothetical protein ACIA49_28750 [Kribbella sp. NPDC051587]|uniref:hypothetical protein n=1 Tax=Kribbella sp. NPDC051587 TaxID=3364119 RepID=UPI00379A11D5